MFALMTLILTLLLSVTAQANEQTEYRYCQVSIKGTTSVVSTIFRTQGKTYNLGYSFKLHIDAEFGEYPNVVYCPVFKTYQDAQNARNSEVGDLRRKDWTVHTVQWSYRGD